MHLHAYLKLQKKKKAAKFGARKKKHSKKVGHSSPFKPFHIRMDEIRVLPSLELCGESMRASASM